MRRKHLQIYLVTLVLLTIGPPFPICAQEKLSSQTSITDLTAEEKMWLKEHPVIHLGYHTEQPPLLIQESNGTYTGILVNFVDLLNKRLGTNIIIEAGKWTGIVDRVQKKALDGTLAMTSQYADQKGLLKTKNHISGYPTLFARSDRTFDIRTIDGLAGKTISYPGQVYWCDVFLESLDNRIRRHHTQSMTEAFEQVLDGQADMALGVNTDMFQIIRNMMVGVEPKKIFWNMPIEAVMGIRNDWPEFVSILNKVMDSISEKEKTALVQKWIGVGAEKKQLLVLTEDEKTWLKQHPQITLGGGVFPPLDFVDKTGEMVGLGIDYARQIETLLGIRFNQVSGDWAEIQAKARRRDIDGLRLLSRNKERETYLNFTKAYNSYSYVIIMRQEDTPIPTLAQLNGRHVAVHNKEQIHIVLTRDFPNITCEPKDTNLEVLRALINKEVDQVIILYPSAKYLIEENFIPGLKVTGFLTEVETTLHIGIRKDWPELIPILDKAIDAIPYEKSKKLTDKWLSGKIMEIVRLSDKERVWLKAHPAVEVLTDITAFPYTFVDKDEKIVGFATDIAKFIQQKTGLRLFFRGGTYDELVDAINAETPDIATLLDPPDADYENAYVRTDEYAFLPFALFARSDNEIFDAPDKRIENKKILLIDGWDMDHPTLAPFIRAGNTFEFVGTYLEGINRLLNGSADLFLDVYSIIDRWINEKGIQQIGVVRVLDDGYPALFFVRKAWPEAASIINKALATIPKQKKLELATKWGAYFSFHEAQRRFDLSDEEKSWLREHPVIRVGADTAWAPVEFLSKKGNFRGVTIEYLKEVESMLGITFEYEQDSSWQRLLQKAERQQIDMLSAVVETPMRKEHLHFTEPYLTLPIVLFGGEETRYIGHLRELRHKRVAVVEGYAYSDILGEARPTFIPAENIEKGMMAVARKDADVCVETLLTGSYYLGKMGLTNIKVVGETGKSIQLAMGVRKDWPIFAGILDKTLKAIPEKKKSQIYARSISVQYEHAFDSELLMKVGGGFLVIVIFISWTNWRLRRAVTARTKELSESNERYLGLVENAPDGIMLCEGPEGKFVEANSQAFKIFKTSRSTLIGRNVLDFSPPVQPNGRESRAYAEELIAKTLDGERPVFEWIHTDAEGRNFPCEVRLARLVWEGDALFRVSLMDITARKKAEEEKREMNARIHQMEKMDTIGQLAGGIAHDFNNILGAMLGYAELVKLDLPAGSRLLDKQEKIILAALRAKKLIDQILLFSRQSEQVVSPIQPHLMIKEALKLLRSSIPTTIEIKQNVPSNLGHIVADPTHVHQIVMNLCTNAYHSMREKGGILAVTLSEVSIHKNDVTFDKLDLAPGTYLVLEVNDTGHGMDQETREKIFNPYFTTKSKGDGTGLGLSVVHGIVKNYNGHIRVYSEPGHGTNIRVYFPKVEPPGTAPEGHSDMEMLTGDEHILVVDDDPTMLEMTGSSLQSLGYRVTSFSDSREALETFQTDPTLFDLVITDMTMPKMTGLELSKHLLEIKPDLPIIICTGYSELITKEKAEALGIKAFLLKPVLRKELSETIRNVLDKHIRNIR